MRKQYQYWLTALVLVVLSVGVLVYQLRAENVSIDSYSIIDRQAKIRPDYSNTVIPGNIAPLNFIIKEDGLHYFVRIRSMQGEPIEIFSKTAKIFIPEKVWHKLLDMNRGQELFYEVFVKSRDGQWERFETMKNKIAAEDIDGFVAYRKIVPGSQSYSDMGIYQRNLHNFDETVVMESYLREHGTRHGCVNCHTFHNNRTELMTFRKSGNSILVKDGQPKKLGTKFGYASWHPSGRLIIYSLNNVVQVQHFARSEVRDVFDMDSLIAYYNVDTQTIKVPPQLAKKERLENYPTWSPDGRYAYFCSGPKLWSDLKKVPPEHYDKVKYDLMRVSYDIETDTWGQLETVLTAQETGLSILEPRISPDGRWLLFCMCNYGPFPVYQQSSDLYLMDLKAAEQTGEYEYRRLEINSDQSESWHSWSSNSKWIAFSSKRDYGVFTRTYFSYVDDTGKVYKPILMPQKDPLFYDSYLKTYSVPELIIEPVRAAKEKLGRIVRGSDKINIDMPITMATPEANAVPSPSPPWEDR